MARRGGARSFARCKAEVRTRVTGLCSPVDMEDGTDAVYGIPQARCSAILESSPARKTPFTRANIATYSI